MDAERVGDLFDEDVRVGRARFLEHGSPNTETDKARVWNWSVFPFLGFWRGHTVEQGGRERSKEEAKPQLRRLTGGSARSPARGTRT